MAVVAATATARAQLRLKVEAFLRSNVVGDAGGHDFTIEQIVDLANGTGAGNCDKVYLSDRTLAGTATEDLDLAGSLVDAIGAGCTFVKVKAIVIKNTSPTDSWDISVGPAAATGFGTGTVWNAATDRSIVPAGGCLFWFDPNGVACAAGSTDLLTITGLAGLGSHTYKILLIGASA